MDAVEQHLTENCYPTDSGKVDTIQVVDTENDHYPQGEEVDLALGESALEVVLTLEEGDAWVVEQQLVVGLAWEVDQE